MKNCPICHSEQSAENPKSCFQCGYLFDKNAGFSSDTPTENNDDLDFTVSEANDDEREFVGGNKSSFNDDMDITVSEANEDEQELEKKNKSLLSMEDKKDDDLNIETTTDLMEKEAQSVIQKEARNVNLKDMNRQPIGESTPPPPVPADSSDLSIEKTGSNINNSETSINTTKTGKVKILSQDEIKKIEQNLYKSDNYLSEKEKKDLIKNIDKNENEPFSNTPITPPKVEHKENKIIEKPEYNLPKPKISKKSKGIAYFYKQYIQLGGNQVLFIDDEILINNREYILRPKKIKMSLLIGAGALSFALILFIVGSLFISDISSGKGQLVGVVLDNYDKPFINGATIRIKELGKTINTNPQGFFKLEDIPIGTQQIEYIINENVVKVDFATISDNQISMIILRPEITKKQTKKYTKPRLTQKSKNNNTSKKTPAYTKKVSSGKTSIGNNTKKASKQSKKKSSTTNYTNYSKITLKANIDGAKLAIDGSILGAGNLTFSKIKSGNHKYEVSLDGYSSIKGFINLSPGENKKLKVSLSPLDKAKKQIAYELDDFFYSGKIAYKNGNYETAINDFSEVIRKQPSNAEAYVYRGETHIHQKNNIKAHDDFIRAAEIYQFKKNYNSAISCYNKAIESDSKSITAYLGRANLYSNKSEELAAIADYDRILKLDKRNFKAYYGLGKVKFKRGEYKSAIKHFKNARSIESKNPLVYQYLMLSYMAADDYKNVKKSFQKFSKVANDEQMKQLVTNKKYTAILKIIDND